MKNLNSMNKYFWLVLLSLAAFTRVDAQYSICGSDEYYQQQIKKNPQIEQDRINSDIQTRAVMYGGAASKVSISPDAELLIPVVFHIITTATHPVTTNLSACKDQIRRLNEDYSATNSDTTNIRPIFKSRLGNAHIRFILATKDPQGNPTTGVTKDTSILTYQAGDSVKSVIDWDHNFYLNVWVVSNINSSSLPKGSTIAGYAVFPWDGVRRGKSDGVVIDHNFVGYTTDRTLTHEIGHILGLYHTFQGGCTIGDEIDDTPPVTAANLSKCNSWPTSDTTINTCHNDVPDLPDMLENIMDYASCKVMFTKEQVVRMRLYLTTNRVSLFYYNTVAGIANEASLNTAAISVFPNPTTENFTVEANGISAGKTVHIKCYDMMGRLHLDQAVVASSEGDFTQQIDGSQIIPGVYKIVLYEGNEMKAVKSLVKE